MIESAIRKAGLFLALLAALAGSAAGQASAATAGAAIAPAAGCALQLGDYRELPPPTVLQVQDALAWFKLYSARIDKVVGRETREGLSAYCRQRGLTVSGEPASRQALIDELLRDSAVARVYADWRSIVASARFKDWIATQPDRASLPSQSTRGTPARIIDIITRFLKSLPAPAKPPANASLDDYRVSYRLGDSDLPSLVRRQQLLARLAPLKGGGFLDRADFIAQLRELLKDDSDDGDAFQELVMHNADSMSRFAVPAPAIVRLRAAGVPADLLSVINELPAYGSRADLEQELRILLAGGGAAPTGAGEAPAPAEPVARHSAEDGRKWLALILAEVDETVAYRLSDAAWERLKLATGGIPASVAPLLQGLRDIDFPTRRLFIAAARARIDGFNRLIGTSLRDLNLDHLGVQDIEFLKSLGVPPERLTPLDALVGKRFADSSALDKAVADALAGQLGDLDKLLETLAAQARRPHSAAEARQGMLLANTSDCKCLPTNMNGTIYGFYPFWRDERAPAVDFSALGRIGYYALDFDDQGELQLPDGWAAASADAFFTANRFRTRVDLVLARRDWRSWQTLDRRARDKAFDALAVRLGQLVQRERDDPFSSLKRQLGVTSAESFDGVTLFFENYPDDSESIEVFEKFVTRLHETLRGGQAFLNLMLPQGGLGSGIFGYDNLLQWAGRYAGLAHGAELQDVAPRMLFLVLLEAPSTDNKKTLRKAIEDHSHGRSRYILTRMTVPVLVPDLGAAAATAQLPNRQNLTDDVIYMQDNFGGIGFWPLLGSGESTTEVVAKLKAEFNPEQSNQTSAVCGIVCPNRWAFRLAFDFFVLVCALCLIAYLSCCGCRQRFRSYFIPFLAVTVLPAVALGMSLLYCDPFLESVAQGNTLLLMLVAAIIVYAVWNNRSQKRVIP